MATHGTRTCYNRGCRRPECVQAEKDYNRSRRQAKNAQKVAQGAPAGAPADGVGSTSVVPFKLRSAPAQIEAAGDTSDDEDQAPSVQLGSTTSAVLAELSELKTMQTRPGLVAVALALARVLDSPAAVAQWPSAAHRLSETLDKLRKGSEGRSGRLAAVQRMTTPKKATG